MNAIDDGARGPRGAPLANPRAPELPPRLDPPSSLDPDLQVCFRKRPV